MVVVAISALVKAVMASTSSGPASRIRVIPRVSSRSQLVG
jgi:hypothetical protein